MVPRVTGGSFLRFSVAILRVAGVSDGEDLPEILLIDLAAGLKG